MIDIEEERKAFEAWYDAPVPMARSRNGDGYAYAAANNAWKVWQARAAYKSIDDVMAAQADLIEVVHTLKQVVCVKG